MCRSLWKACISVSSGALASSSYLICDLDGWTREREEKTYSEKQKETKRETKVKA